MKNNRLIIIGAGGYSAVVAETALLCGFEIIGFADDNKPLNTPIYNNLTVVSSIAELQKKNTLIFDFFIVAIGNNNIRKLIYEKLSKMYSSINIIHPNCVISSSAKMKNGNVFLAGSVINTNSIFGENNIINSMVLVDHDCNISSHCHISQGCIIGSNVTIGNEYLISIGRVIPSFSDLA